VTDGLRLAGITFRYGSDGPPTLSDINLEVPRGEMAALVGGSGSGKSSLLRVVAGLEQPSDGEIFFEGRSLLALPPAERAVGMVFQDYALYPHLTVRGNLEFPLRAQRRPMAEIRASVTDVAQRLRLDALLDRKPGALSGGQRQRVALGRMLVRSPAIALFDEPLSNLDTVLKREIRLEIRRLHDARGWTSLYVTHDSAEAMALADRIAVIAEGRVVQFDRANALRQHPMHTKVIELLASAIFNLAPPDTLPDGWLNDGDRASQVALKVRALEAVAGSDTGIPAIFLGPSDSESDLAVVQMPWGGHWLVRQSCEATMGAPVQVVYRSAEELLFFDHATGLRKSQ
jgi:ABC-type sugar transport system ATPase subunit